MRTPKDFPRLSVMKTAILIGTFIFVFAFMSVGPAKKKESSSQVYCPNMYAIQVAPGTYIKCEDFDQYYSNLAYGVTRRDMHLTE